MAHPQASRIRDIITDLPGAFENVLGSRGRTENVPKMTERARSGNGWRLGGRKLTVNRVLNRTLGERRTLGEERRCGRDLGLRCFAVIPAHD
jgi:hypothetical protein